MPPYSLSKWAVESGFQTSSRPWFSIVDTDSVTTYTYNDAGQTLSVDSPIGIVSYEYDDTTGRLSRTYTGDGLDAAWADTDYTYDSLGRLDTVSANAETTTYTYYDDGALRTITRVKDTGPSNNGVTSVYTYNDLGHIDTLTHYKNAAGDDLADLGTITNNPALASFDYTTDAAGNRTAVTEIFDDNADGNLVEDTDLTTDITWTYDDLGRLVTEVVNSTDNALDYTANYTFDLVGNRLTYALTGTTSRDTTVTYTYNDIDQLLTEAHVNVGVFDTYTTYTYDGTDQDLKKVYAGTDDTGALLSETDQDYNVAGRLGLATLTTHDSTGDGVVDGSDTTATTTTAYTYNAEGIRTTQTVDDGTTTTVTLFLNDNNNPTGYNQVLQQGEDADADGKLDSGEVTVTYTVGLRVLAQHAPSAADLYLLTDAHGSTRLITDSTAVARGAYFFDAYGNALAFTWSGTLATNNPTVSTTILYSGEQWDATLGQQYLRARYYDPTTGRFNRLDPFFGDLNNPRSFHKYLYAHANPIMGTDPTGLFTLAGLMASTSIISNLQSLKIGVDQAIYDSFQSAAQSIQDRKTTEGALAQFGIESAIGFGIGFGIGLGVKGLSALWEHGLTIKFRLPRFRLPKFNLPEFELNFFRSSKTPGCFIEGTPVWIADTAQVPEVQEEVVLAGFAPLEVSLQNPYQRYMLASGLISLSLVTHLTNKRLRKRTSKLILA